MIKKGMLTAATVVLALSLGACASNRDMPNVQQVPGERPIPFPSKIQEYTNFREAESVGNALAGKYGVQSAYVFVVDTTAFVAVKQPPQATAPLTPQTKNEIANEAKRVDPSIRDVFVSTDPNLYQKFQGYSRYVRAGHPTQVVYEDFAEEIHRVFPQR